MPAIHGGHKSLQRQDENDVSPGVRTGHTPVRAVPPTSL
jgi:hypothetical protein